MCVLEGNAIRGVSGNRCLTEMVHFATERQAFGKSILEFGQIQRYVAEAFARTEAARALVYRAADEMHPDRRNRIASDAAKLFCAPVGKSVADDAMQVFGGAGYCAEFPIERIVLGFRTAPNPQPGQPAGALTLAATPRLPTPVPAFTADLVFPTSSKVGQNFILLKNRKQNLNVVLRLV